MADNKQISGAKADGVAIVRGADAGLLVVAALLVVAGIAAYYLLPPGVAPALRASSVLGAIVLAGAVVWFTTLGRALRGYLRETQFEMRKVVWPTREETIRTTIVVALVVIALALVLGLIDVILKWVILDHLLKL